MTDDLAPKTPKIFIVNHVTSNAVKIAIVKGI
jgi:hypothetical protein